MEKGLFYERPKLSRCPSVHPHAVMRGQAPLVLVLALVQSVFRRAQVCDGVVTPHNSAHKSIECLAPGDPGTCYVMGHRRMFLSSSEGLRDFFDHLKGCANQGARFSSLNGAQEDITCGVTKTHKPLPQQAGSAHSSHRDSITQ